ncbi:6-phosphogluconolactonase [Jiangella rhizosphaerae]|uniref:Glucosamine/galactosamine-6-phosphate isomerase domain-containing protein n=1 Tax=Jiangella rhizosphaerae TaxID=2293569 RepID=A0A418KV15_9ACTN|nr:6-phosphogluconolactonase [Jiangella rhizosphaerae]RIQ33676.1 hypothetical protein DY240_04540 [Jiangella rhizosphaerae]
MTTTRVFADADELGRALAAEILADLDGAGGRYLLGCPGGRSLMPTYRAVADALEAAPRDLSRLVIVMMDDYLAGPGRRVGTDLEHSCERFGWEHIARPWTEAVAPLPGVTEVWMPDPADPAAYDDRIAAAGGIDLFLLASGASDGHVAFNPPGSGLADRTRVIDLAETTRRDNLATFPHLGTLDAVPRQGVSVGPATIVRLSRRVRLVATGAAKAASVRRIRAASGWDPDWPATLVHECRDAELWVDEAALS